MSEMQLTEGYRFAGVHSGIRPDPQRLDLALVVSDRPAAAAGVFTQNRVCAAPVHICRKRLPSASARGVVICSGNANACTGKQGLHDAERMAEVAAEAVGCKAKQMLVCSTGVIGRFLPMDCVEPGIRQAAEKLQPTKDSFSNAAHAILTTDTKIKVYAEAGDASITAFAKGAAMIGPNMATMLGFVLSDAAVEPDDLAKLAKSAVQRSFNCLSVEGHTSTNDTVLFFANGEGKPLHGKALRRFGERLETACFDLARQIAADAEGAKHLVRIEVEGLRNDADAHRIAKTVAESALVKTAIFGADPNWGRVVSAAGYAGVAFEEKDLSLWMGDLLLYKKGTPQDFDAKEASAYLKNNREVTFRLKFNLGSGSCNFWTCDLTDEYVRLNADYTT
ncbi:MAG: bifunctional glutamate N-acetyltransferase/amino-acid acetyltransferase ArgJ [Planctomycetia bacterium]|nr:bifunctional glutamate N-acetyltransferase/amino-acid acetyltransferase ArgJ [Planctomycetia bacterium]